MAERPVARIATPNYHWSMTKSTPVSSTDARKMLLERLRALRAREDREKKRIELAESKLGQARKRLEAIERDSADAEAQLALLAQQRRGRPVAGLPKFTRKNRQFHEAWICIQIAFKGSDKGFVRFDHSRALTQDALYKDVRWRLFRNNEGKPLKDSTFRSYLHRLKNENLLWKHDGKWRLTEKALASGREPAARKEEMTITK